MERSRVGRVFEGIRRLPRHARGRTRMLHSRGHEFGNARLLPVSPHERHRQLFCPAARHLRLRWRLHHGLADRERERHWQERFLQAIDGRCPTNVHGCAGAVRVLPPLRPGIDRRDRRVRVRSQVQIQNGRARRYAARFPWRLAARAHVHADRYAHHGWRCHVAVPVLPGGHWLHGAASRHAHASGSQPIRGDTLRELLKLRSNTHAHGGRKP
mmetsp:Transcript_6818/g.12199  ORF Transcript_6818/g.12199 Transcript_6818/m.12199 type:complete len:213 (+) Transcript_6818:558-1196(+)